MTKLPVPGTVHLVDLQGTSNLRHGGQGEIDIILVPQPTEDPNDPLNWSRRRRLTSSIIQIVWTFFGSGFINALTPAYLLIEQDTGISVANLNTGNGLMYLFFGFGNLLTQPLALNYGRRPAAVVSLFATSLLVLWASFMKSSGEWYANRILVGIFFSGIECLIELCITDTKFTHERGLYMGIYNLCLNGGPFLAPIPAGFLADAAGWRWINRMYFVVGIVCTILVFFFFEETMFFRPRPASESLAENSISSSPSKSEANQDSGPAESETNNEKPPYSESSDAGEVDGQQPVFSYMHRVKLWRPRDPRQPNTFFKFFLLPFQLFRYPPIVFCGILIGTQLSWFNVLLGTITEVFSDDPYNFNANLIGLTYLSCFLGSAAGCVAAGPLSDWLAKYMARRNNGIKEPEARLWTALIPTILHPAGCILYGVGAAHQIHWVGLCFGMGLITMAILMGSTIALNYLVDCYPEIAGTSLITSIIIRNCMGFAFSYAISPMISSLGLQGAFLLIAFLGMALTGTSFIMIAFGKSMRSATAVAYWKLVEQHGFHAH